jgi:hypothetical protein
VVITNGYATLAEVKAELRLTTAVDDARVERKIEAASRTIDMATSRPWFITANQAVIYASQGNTVWLDDCKNITKVEQSLDQATWSTVTAGTYYPNPRLPIRRLVFVDTTKHWQPFVRVTADWGNDPPVPAQLREATILYAVRLFKRPDTPEGVLMGDFGAARLSREDPDILKMVRPLSHKVIG